MSINTNLFNGINLDISDSINELDDDKLEEIQDETKEEKKEDDEIKSKNDEDENEEFDTEFTTEVEESEEDNEDEDVEENDETGNDTDDVVSTTEGIKEGNKTLSFLSTLENDDNILSFESISNVELNPGMEVKQQIQTDKFCLRTCDNIIFHLYFESVTILNKPSYVNKFCRFLDTRSEGEIVYIHLGSCLDEYQWLEIGAIVSAMVNCKAKLITIADGSCSSTETMLWIFGHKREIGKYGQIYFSLGEFKYDKLGEYKPYINSFFEQVKALNLLTDEEIEKVLYKNQDFCFFGEEAKEKIKQNNNGEVVHKNSSIGATIPPVTEEVKEEIVTDNKVVEEDPTIEEELISNEGFSIGYD